MMVPDLTFCGIYRNEANNVRRVLDIGSSLCEQMVIGVQKSDDDTLNICKEYPTAKVIEFSDKLAPEECRDEIISQVKTRWTFWLDADELPSIDLILMLEHADLPISSDAIKFPRINYINGKHIEANQGVDEQFRLIRSDVRWNPKQQGRRCHIYPLVKNPVSLPFPIYHHRTLEKIEATTKRWNELEPQTEYECNLYLTQVKQRLKHVKP